MWDSVHHNSVDRIHKSRLNLTNVMLTFLFLMTCVKFRMWFFLVRGRPVAVFLFEKAWKANVQTTGKENNVLIQQKPEKIMTAWPREGRQKILSMKCAIVMRTTAVVTTSTARTTTTTKTKTLEIKTETTTTTMSTNQQQQQQRRP